MKDYNVMIKEPLKVSHHPFTFGDYRHSDSGNVIILVCHVS